MKKLIIMGALALSLASTQVHGFLGDILGGGGSSSPEQAKAQKLFWGPFEQMTYDNQTDSNFYYNMAKQISTYRATYQGKQWEGERSKAKDYLEEAMKYYYKKGEAFYPRIVTMYEIAKAYDLDPKKRKSMVELVNKVRKAGAKAIVFTP